MKLGVGAKALFVLAATVVVCAGIRLAADVLVPFFLAAFLATVTMPLIAWLGRRRVPIGVAILVAMLLDVAALAGFAALLGGSVNAFYQRLPKYQLLLRSALDQTLTWLSQHGVRVSAQQASDVVDTEALITMLGTLVRGVTGLVSDLVLVLLMVAFMLLEGVAFQGKLVRVAGNDDALGWVRGAMREVNKYLAVKTGTSLATGLFVGIWTALWGLELSVLWGVIAFVLNFIPTLGSIIAAVPAVLLALLEHGWGAGLGVASGYLAVNFVVGNGLEPRIMGRALGLSPLVVFLSMVFWGWLLGPVGALLSVPLTMVLKIVLSHTGDLEWVAEMLSPPRREDASTLSGELPAPPAGGS